MIAYSNSSGPPGSEPNVKDAYPSTPEAPRATTALAAAFDAGTTTTTAIAIAAAVALVFRERSHCEIT